MKKLLALAIALLMVSAMAPVICSADEALIIEKIDRTPAINGVIAEGEWGDPIVVRDIDVKNAPSKVEDFEFRGNPEYYNSIDGKASIYSTGWQTFKFGKGVRPDMKYYWTYNANNLYVGVVMGETEKTDDTDAPLPSMHS